MKNNYQRKFQSWTCNIIRQIQTYIIMHNADINLWVYPNVTSKPSIWTNVSKTMLAAMTSNYITKIHWLAFYDFFQWIAFLCIYLIRHSSDKIHFYAIDLQNTWKGYTRVLIELTVTAHLFFRVRAPELNTSQRAASAKINVRHQTQGMLQRIKWSRRQY